MFFKVDIHCGEYGSSRAAKHTQDTGFIHGIQWTSHCKVKLLTDGNELSDFGHTVITLSNLPLQTSSMKMWSGAWSTGCNQAHTCDTGFIDDTKPIGGNWGECQLCECAKLSANPVLTFLT